ncbi:MAG: hypothetical protein AMXMBFR82_11510 [Candidatus Hydrogenedentota bacterium]
MLDRLIEYVSAMPEDELGEVTLQDIAICDSWYRSLAGDAAALSAHETLPKKVKGWSARPAAEVAVTEGRRHQWVLRELIDELTAGNTQYLAWDELDMLLASLQLAKTCARPDQFARVIQLLERHATAIEDRYEKVSITPRLPALSTRLHVVTERDIVGAKPREIKMFAGINIQGRGPVLIHRAGHLKVLGSVPENCTLVIEEGSCSVDGFVMGKVAASQHCEVRENISGVVVVRQGNIRARNIIVRAYVVSKWGGVHCRSAESPDLVFGGSEVCIEQTAIMGKYISPSIHVRGDVYGGVFMVSRELTAARFRRSDARELAIVLRTSLSCQDYGEEPGPEALRHLAQTANLQRRISALETRILYSQAEAEHAARNAIVYLTGKDQLHPVAEKLGQAEHRLAQVNRIRAVLQTLVELGEDRLGRLERLKGLSTDESETLEESSLDDVTSDFAHLEAEGGFAKDVTDELSDIAAIKERMLATSSDVRKTASSLHQVRERRAYWDKEAVELRAVIAKYEAQLREVFTAKEVLDNRSGSLPTVALLKQFLGAVKARAKSLDDPLGRRMQSSFVQLSLRTVSTRMDRLSSYVESKEKLTEQLRGVAEVLRKEYQIAVPVDDFVRVSPRVTGVFETGVKIYADPYLLNEPAPPKGAMLETVGGKEDRRTYLRENGRIFAAS